MKNLLTIFSNFILTFVAVACTIGAITSAFSFELNNTTAILVWLISTLAISFNFAFWRLKGLLILLIPALALLIWRLPEILSGAQWVAHYITNEYYTWLFVPVLFPEAEPCVNELTLFFSAAGALLSFLVSYATSVRHSTVLTVVFTVPIVALTFVLIFNRSAPVFLMGLLAVYLTLLISNGLSPDNYVKRGLAVFPAFILVALLMGFTYLAAPPEGYARGATVSAIDSQMRVIASRLGISRVKTGVGWPMLYGDRWGFNTGNVGISEAGTRVIHDISILEVTSSSEGVFYLRGYSMQHFDGHSWTTNSEDIPLLAEGPLARGFPALIARHFASRFPDRAPRGVEMTIYITGDATRNVVYTPYFSFPSRFYGSPYSFEFFYVEDGLLNLHAALPAEDLAHFSLASYNVIVSRSDTYLQIADSTAEGLRMFAADIGIDASASRAVIADQVAQFMTSFGVYTLSPFIIPMDEDFVMYFLEVSRQGYCIHYATVATMMLRALGVPARFTSGFVVAVSPENIGEPINVTDRNAHAWVEVYFNDVGWLPLEVTPPATGFGEWDGRPILIGQGTTISPGLGFDYDEPIIPEWYWYYDLMHGSTPGESVRTVAQNASPSDQTTVLRSVLIGCLIAVIIASPFIHRLIAVNIRGKRFAQEDTDVAAIHTWRYLNRLHRFRQWEELPEGISDIAFKARFSKNTIPEEERTAIVAYSVGYASKVCNYRGPFMRFFIKYVCGL